MSNEFCFGEDHYVPNIQHGPPPPKKTEKRAIDISIGYDIMNKGETNGRENKVQSQASG